MCTLFKGMKLIFRKLEKDSSGELKLVAEDAEDMWHAYNLIAVGDRLTTTALRKVKKESSTGSVESKKVRTTLKIQVVDVDFDTEGGMIRLSGRNVAENQYVKMGAHHTLEMELHRAFAIEKDNWDLICLERIDAACDQMKRADAAAVVLEPGLAHICLLTTNMTLLRSKIEKSIPRKRSGASGHDKAMLTFFDRIVEALLRHVNFEIVKCILVASPGFTREQFLEHMHAYAVKTGNRELIENKSKFVSVHSSSGHIHALNEVLLDPAVTSRMADTKCAKEMDSINKFYQLLDVNPDKAFYGYKHVERANEQQAIQTLMVTDGLFRACDIPTRKKYVALVESAQENGAEVQIFSSMHVSGNRLTQLSGVAAMLRFPLPEVDADDDSETDSDSEDSEGGNA